MAGYYGQSMSNNAMDAYSMGERPMSKWSKADIIDEVYRLDDGYWEKVGLNRFHLGALREFFLTYAGWHHTSKHYNCTEFYSIDENAVEDHDLAALEREESFAVEELAEKKERAICAVEKGRIVFEEWEGSRRYGKFVRHERECLIRNMWAYTINGKKRIDGSHIIRIERFARAPKGTAATYRKIARAYGL